MPPNDRLVASIKVQLHSADQIRRSWQKRIRFLQMSAVAVVEVAVVAALGVVADVAVGVVVVVADVGSSFVSIRIFLPAQNCFSKKI